MLICFTMQRDNICIIPAQNIKVEVNFTLVLLRYFIPHKGSIVYFSTQTSVAVCYWKSICTFLGSHLLREMEACSCFLLFLLSMSSGDSDYQRLFSVPGRAPRGPLSLFCAGAQSLCGGWGLFWALSSLPSSNCRHPFKKTSDQGTLAKTATLWS